MLAMNHVRLPGLIGKAFLITHSASGSVATGGGSGAGGDR